MSCDGLGELVDIFVIFCITLTPVAIVFTFTLLVYLLFTPYWCVTFLYSCWWYYDRHSHDQGGRQLVFFRNLFVWRYFARYFPIKLHKTVDLDQSKKYLFAVHPHGLFVMGAYVNFGTNATGFDKLFPGIDVHVLSVDHQLHAPLIRDFLISFLGLSSVNSKNIDYILSKMGPSHSAWIAVGGGAEAFLSNDQNSYTLKLQYRKGFVRKALQNRVLVVPVFSFNEHRVYDIPPLERFGVLPYYFYKFMNRFDKNVLPTDVRGRWWWSGPFVPKPLPLNTVVGAPIDFNELKSFNGEQDPSEELVAECHEIYKNELRKLYDEHKARFGDENTALIFV